MPEAIIPDPEALALYERATEKQEMFMARVYWCADARSRALRTFVAQGMSQLDIAALLDLSQSTVHRIIHRDDSVVLSGGITDDTGQ